jgi:hypothetical protein
MAPIAQAAHRDRFVRIGREEGGKGKSLLRLHEHVSERVG